MESTCIDYQRKPRLRGYKRGQYKRASKQADQEGMGVGVGGEWILGDGFEADVMSLVQTRSLLADLEEEDVKFMVSEYGGDWQSEFVEVDRWLAEEIDV
jgi:hypothetical protein